MRNLIDWHKDVIKKYQIKWNISDYQALWISFSEGIIYTLLVLWII